MAQDDILRKASKKLGDMVNENEKARLQPEQDRRDFISTLSKEMVNTLSPLIAGLTAQSKADSASILNAIASIKVNVPKIDSPQVKLPTINVPTPKVNVQVPDIKVPQINVPKTTVNIPDTMNVRMGDINKMNALPVMMFDGKGRPQSFSQGAGGGKADFFTIKDIRDSSNVSIINAEGKLAVDASVSVGDVTVSQDFGSGEIGSETVRMVMATDAIASVNIVGGSSSGTEYTDGDVDSSPDGKVAMWLNSAGEVINAVSSTAALPVNVVDAFGSTAVSDMINGDNRIRVSVETGGSGLTDSELRAANVPVSQVSGATWSTNVVGFTASVAAHISDSSGVGYSGSNPVPINLFGISGAEVEVSTGGGDSVSNTTNELATQGNTYAFNNTSWDRVRIGEGTKETAMRVVHAVDAVGSVFVTGATESFLAYEVMTTNKTAKADGADVRPKADTMGRAVVRPVQVRGLLQTAFAAVITGTEATLLAGASGVFHDLVYLMAANHSDVAVQVDIRQTTGGTIQASLDVPANSTAGLSLGGATIPQDHADATWTVDLGDDTQDCDVTALFSKEI